MGRNYHCFPMLKSRTTENLYDWSSQLFWVVYLTVMSPEEEYADVYAELGAHIQDLECGSNWISKDASLEAIQALLIISTPPPSNATTPEDFFYHIFC